MKEQGLVSKNKDQGARIWERNKDQGVKDNKLKMEKVHIAIRITGKVQGVGFRETTKYVADQSGIKGSVRNEPDGSVYLEAEGEQWELDAFIEWCNEGPDRAIVESCTVTEGVLKNFRDFVILKK